MRQCRILQKGAKYHVSSKINRSENIFENDEIKKLFMDVVKRAKKKYKFIVHNFVIMNNHIHIYISRKKEVIYNKLKSIHKDNNTYSIATELRYILKVFLRGVEMYGINKFLLLLKSAEKKWNNKNKKFWYKKIKVRQLSLKKQFNIQYDNKYSVIFIKLLN